MWNNRKNDETHTYGRYAQMDTGTCMYALYGRYNETYKHPWLL